MQRHVEQTAETSKKRPQGGGKHSGVSVYTLHFRQLSDALLQVTVKTSAASTLSVDTADHRTWILKANNNTDMVRLKLPAFNCDRVCARSVSLRLVFWSGWKLLRDSEETLIHCSCKTHTDVLVSCWARSLSLSLSWIISAITGYQICQNKGGAEHWTSFIFQAVLTALESFTLDFGLIKRYLSVWAERKCKTETNTSWKFTAVGSDLTLSLSQTDVWKLCVSYRSMFIGVEMKMYSPRYSEHLYFLSLFFSSESEQELQTLAGLLIYFSAVGTDQLATADS